MAERSIYQRELANKIRNGRVVGNLYVVTRRPIGLSGIVASFETEEAREEWLKERAAEGAPFDELTAEDTAIIAASAARRAGHRQQQYVQGESPAFRDFYLMRGLTKTRPRNVFEQKLDSLPAPPYSIRRLRAAYAGGGS